MASKRNPKSASKKKEEEEEEEEEEDILDEEEDEEEDDEEDDDDQEQGDAPKEKKIEDIRNIDVVTKYRVAGNIANEALQLVIKETKPGASVVGLCETGDKYILDAVSKVFNKGKVSKGIGFPTCVSVNHIVGSFSPLKSDDTQIKAGDLVKVDLGVQVDGYLSMVAHTYVVGEAPVTGKKADVIVAASIAADCVLRMLKPGTTNTQITQVIEKVAKEFKCNAVESIFSHRCTKFDIDTEHVISNRAPEPTQNAENKTKEVKIDVNEVWAVDIVLSTGSGKPSPVDDRTTVYKRAIETTYALKMKTSRAVLAEVNNKFPVYPFTIRSLDLEEKKAKLGILECFKHQLVDAYPVVHEKDGDFVANVKFTALVLPEHTLKITGLALDPNTVKSEFSITDDSVKAVLATAVSRKASKKKKSKKKSSKKSDKPKEDKPTEDKPKEEKAKAKEATPAKAPKAATESSAKSAGSPSAKPAGTPAKPAESPKPAGTPAKPTKSAESPSAKPAESPKPAGTPAKPAKPAESPSAKPAESPSAKPAESPSAKPAGTPAKPAKSAESPSAKPVETKASPAKPSTPKATESSPAKPTTPKAAEPAKTPKSAKKVEK